MHRLQTNNWVICAIAIVLPLSMTACSHQKSMPLTCSINQQIDVYPSNNYSSHWTLFVQDSSTYEEIGRAHLLVGWSSTAIDKYAVTLTQDMRTFSIPMDRQNTQVQIEIRETNNELDSKGLRPSQTSSYGNYDPATGRWTEIHYGGYLRMTYEDKEGFLRWWVTLYHDGKAKLEVGEEQFGDFTVHLRFNPDQAHASNID